MSSGKIVEARTESGREWARSAGPKNLDERALYHLVSLKREFGSFPTYAEFVYSHLFSAGQFNEGLRDRAKRFWDWAEPFDEDTLSPTIVAFFDAAFLSRKSSLRPASWSGSELPSENAATERG